MTTEKLKEVLESKIASDEMNDFYVGKIIYKPNACGCININDSWFIYKKMDENCYLSLTGPFLKMKLFMLVVGSLKKRIYLTNIKQMTSFKNTCIIIFHQSKK